MRSRGGRNYFRPDPLRLFVDNESAEIGSAPHQPAWEDPLPASLHVSHADKGGYVRAFI